MLRFPTASIDYDNKVAIYDDYGADMYAIKNNDNHETCHHNFNSQYDYANQVSHDSYFVEFAPTIMNEKKFAYVESNENIVRLEAQLESTRISCVVDISVGRKSTPSRGPEPCAPLTSAPAPKTRTTCWRRGQRRKEGH